MTQSKKKKSKYKFIPLKEGDYLLTISSRRTPLLLLNDVSLLTDRLDTVAYVYSAIPKRGPTADLKKLPQEALDYALEQELHALLTWVEYAFVKRVLTFKKLDDERMTVGGRIDGKGKQRIELITQFATSTATLGVGVKEATIIAELKKAASGFVAELRVFTEGHYALAIDVTDCSFRDLQKVRRRVKKATNRLWRRYGTVLL